MGNKVSPASKESRKKVKIRILKMHVAYIEKRMIDEFQEKCHIEDFNKWFEEEIYNDFYMEIKTNDDIHAFTLMLRKRYYENIAEWIKEKVRFELKKADALKEKRMSNL